MSEKRIPEISTEFIIKTIIILLSVWILYLVRDIMILLFVSIVLTATLDPLVDWMKRKKIPRPLGACIIYALVITVIILLVSFLTPPLIGQFRDFNEKIPQYAEKTNQVFRLIQDYALSYGLNFNIEEFIKNNIGGIFKSSSEIFSRTIGFFHFFISVIVIFSLTFYMLVEEDGMRRFIIAITPFKHREYALSLSDRIHDKIGRWIFGQLILMLAIFLVTWITLSAFGVPFALLIALVAGLLEIVPYIGPIISTIIATILGFLISPVMGLIVLLAFIVIQQVENHILVPQVMKKAVGLNPVAVIVVLLVGAKLGGVLGTILAVPLATALGIFIEDLINKKEEI